MKDDGFIRMISTALPVETQLAVELRCREVMDCDDIDKLKSFCIDMMKNHARSELVLSKAMMKVIELEAHIAVLKTQTKKTEGIYKILWWAEQLKLHLKYRHITKRQSHKA
tara:strand:- start:256 stop:588 length:333 start_codon:yes stop_codon:yes gene_type:complete